MASIHDNPERARLLKRAIGECIACHEGPTLGNVGAKLPADFDLLDEEMNEAIAEMKHAGGGELPVFDVSPKSLEKIGLSHANEVAPPSLYTADATPEPKMTREQSQARIEAAHTALGDARVRVKIAQQKLVRTKGKLAEAVVAWQTATDPLTPSQRREQEIRNHLAGCLAERSARRSSTAITSKQFVQKRMVNGPSRGAFTLQQAARVGFKVPSER